MQLRLIYTLTMCLSVQASMGLATSAKAISGDTFILNNRTVQIMGIRCPAPETEDGLAAQRIANTYLNGKNVGCAINHAGDGSLIGDCKLRGNNGRTLSEVLLATGLCWSTNDAEI